MQYSLTRRSEVRDLGLPRADVVVGTDLCWNNATADLCAAALTAFACAGHRVIMGHWNRSDRVTRYVLEELRARGMVPAWGAHREEALQLLQFWLYQCI